MRQYRFWTLGTPNWLKGRILGGASKGDFARATELGGSLEAETERVGTMLEAFLFLGHRADDSQNLPPDVS